MDLLPISSEVEQSLRALYAGMFVKLGVPPLAVEASFKRLVRRYRESHRRYHTLSHLMHCMIELSRVSAFVKDRKVVLAAIFFHDIIYDPKRGDNEEKSAAYWTFIARQVLELKDGPFITSVARLILCTKTHRVDPAVDSDAALFLDIDMSVLATDSETYDAYADAVRSEYGHYTDDQWALGRMEMFIIPVLKEGRLFLTDNFGAPYEERARTNLARERCRYQRHTPLI